MHCGSREGVWDMEMPCIGKLFEVIGKMNDVLWQRPKWNAFNHSTWLESNSNEFFCWRSSLISPLWVTVWRWRWSCRFKLIVVERMQRILQQVHHKRPLSNACNVQFHSFWVKFRWKRRDFNAYVVCTFLLIWISLHIWENNNIEYNLHTKQNKMNSND